MSASHNTLSGTEIISIPVDRVNVINPRTRNAKIFSSIVDSIATVGLKRPITVAPSSLDSGIDRYDLICGQGRLEAYKALGEPFIPAIVVNADNSDRYLMSLVENLARRRHTNSDLLNAIRVLEERGYNASKISEKTGLATSYIGGILSLLKAGEERLISAVEQGWLPIALACEISRLEDADTQVSMMHAYQEGVLKGEQLIKVRRLIDRRRVLGIKYGRGCKKPNSPMTAKKLLQTYQNEVHRQRLAVKKAEINEGRLLFFVSAIKRLLTDEHFRTILRAEGIADMPTDLAERIKGGER